MDITCEVVRTIRRRMIKISSLSMSAEVKVGFFLIPIMVQQLLQNLAGAQGPIINQGAIPKHHNRVDLEKTPISGRFLPLQPNREINFIKRPHSSFNLPPPNYEWNIPPMNIHPPPPTNNFQDSEDLNKPISRIVTETVKNTLKIVQGDRNNSHNFNLPKGCQNRLQSTYFKFQLSNFA
ncbi:hypothetical protein HHI36_009422 [Cryptolaemus montrouzieri]|uniref:Uncharacterized protein n=1 Tax=Cryptolaemus montrouzieri TaxID=559131 RepID=A0ABD2MVP2_9CUCU